MRDEERKESEIISESRLHSLDSSKLRLSKSIHSPFFSNGRRKTRALHKHSRPKLCHPRVTIQSCGGKSSSSIFIVNIKEYHRRHLCQCPDWGGASGVWSRTQILIPHPISRPWTATANRWELKTARPSEDQVIDSNWSFLIYPVHGLYNDPLEGTGVNPLEK